MPTTHNTTSTAEAVLAALADGATSAAEVAERAGIGRSTATKALAALADQGKVTRKSGGRDGARRLPDGWSLRAAKTRRRTAKGSGSQGRLAKGELGDLVLAYLRANRGEHSPTAVAKALDGRSSGAVGNALARLVEAGDAVQTSEAPRRYKAKRS